MKTRRILTLTLGAALLFAAAALAAAPAEEGKALYTAKCASCHGADGSKTILSKPVKGLSAADFTKMMLGYQAKTFGGSKKATMENLAAKLSEADIKALAGYVPTL